ncbi:MAG: alanine racemase C-terminal domain-containing protein, partial [Planctomycetota bacterium]
GCYPSSDASRSAQIIPALRLVSRLSLVKEIPAGWTVSYGRTFTAKEKMRIGAVAAGYADGLSRKLSNVGKMMVRGRVVPILGRVCMDLTMVDLAGVPEARAGDEVIVYSDRREDPNSVENTAKLTGTIPNEVLCALTARVQRVHVPAEEGELST